VSFIRLHRWILGATIVASLAGCDLFVSADEHVVRAEAQSAQGHYGAAMTELKTVLEDDPEHAQARASLARLTWKLGDLGSAQKELERAVKAGADPASLLELECRIALAAGRLDDLDKLLASDTLMPPARRLMFRGLAVAARGDFAGAQRVFEEALRSAPGDAELGTQFARVRLAQGRPAEAIEITNPLLGSKEQRAAVLLVRGESMLQLRRYVDAAAALSEAQSTGHGQLTVPEEIRVLALLAESQLGARDAAAAQRTAITLESRFGSSLPSRFLRARIAFLKDDYRTAISELQRINQSSPDVPSVRLLLGAALLAQGSLEQAEAELSRLIAQHPEEFAARKLLAQVYLARKAPDTARRVLAEGGERTEADPQLDWLQGAALMMSGSADAAIAHFESGVAQNPRDTGMKVDLASAYLAAGRRDKALEVLEAIPAAERTRRAQGLIVVAHVGGRGRAEARQELERLIAANPKDAGLAGIAGTYAMADGDRQLARRYLTRSIELDPKNIVALMDLAQLEGRENHLDAADALLRDVLKVDPKFQAAFLQLAGLADLRGNRGLARQWLERAIAADASAVQPRLHLAQLALAEGDTRRGRALFEQALSVATDRGEALNAVGEALMRGGRLDEAQARFEEASAAGNRAADINIARVRISLGNLDDARRTLRSRDVMEFAPALVNVMLVQVDARQGRIDEALDRVAELRKFGLPAPAVLELRGDVEMQARRFGAAVQSYMSASAERPTRALVLKTYRARVGAGTPNPEAILTDWLQASPDDRAVRLILAERYQRDGRRRDAIAQYETVAGDGQRDPIVLNNLAWLYFENQDPRAAATAQEAYKLAPQIPQIGDTYGWLLVGQGKAAEALEILRTAARNAPEDPAIRYHLAVAYARNGNKERAVEMLTALLSNRNEFSERAEAQRLLQTLRPG
jgi:cellulose synthase operon protein C